jgi:ATP-dependent RNA helicase DeaD
MLDFKLLNLPGELMQALEAMSFATPTPIQAQAIPLAIQGQDLIATAQTGTGKTAAFCLPLVARLMADPEACAVILSPTRELALQTDEVLKNLTRFSPEIRSAL